MSFDKDKKTRARKGSAWFPPQLENLTGAGTGEVEDKPSGPVIGAWSCSACLAHVVPVSS